MKLSYRGEMSPIALAGRQQRRSFRCGRLMQGMVAALVLLVALVSLCACGKSHNPSLGPKPTAPPNAGPVSASNGETPEQAAVRLYPAARADLLSRGASSQQLTDSEPGQPVPVSADYRYSAALAQWVLPDDAKAVSGDMFGAMWPSAMAKDIFVVPIVRQDRSVGQFIVNLQKGAWIYWGATLSEGDVITLQAATDKLVQLLGEGTEVRPVIFVPSGIAFAVGDNQGREAAVVIGSTPLGPGIDAYSGVMPTVGRLFTPEQLKSLLAGE
jgi:hypothetical protein